MTPKQLWDVFLEKNPQVRGEKYGAWHFALTEELANELLELVLAGKKRATADTLYNYENDMESIPKAGDYSVLTDWSGDAKCVIRTTRVTVLPFKDMTFELAGLEGEDENLESWREGHTRYFRAACAVIGRSFDEDMPVVFEEFALLYQAGQENNGALSIREAKPEDLPALLELYTHLKPEPAPEIDPRVEHVWESMLSSGQNHILLGIVDGAPVSSCVLTVIPNLTHGQRPYALIENVVTHRDCRGRGYATAVLNHAREIAQRENCYKIMLLTGSKEEKTLAFYENAGYNRRDKTAFIQWL
jgi:uncharacterized protein YhfF/ribosomal protein S18 acetylase RimI-like enzyme